MLSPLWFQGSAPEVEDRKAFELSAAVSYLLPRLENVLPCSWKGQRSHCLQQQFKALASPESPYILPSLYPVPTLVGSWMGQCCLLLRWSGAGLKQLQKSAFREGARWPPLFPRSAMLTKQGSHC